MNEEEIMVRAREAAIAELGNPVAYDLAGIRAGKHDDLFGIAPAAQALRELSKPLSEIQPVDPDLIEGGEDVRREIASKGQGHAQPR